MLVSVFVYKMSRKNVYKPGEKIEGLTSELSRNIPKGYTVVRFTDVTEQAGIHFDHFQAERTIQLPEDMGSGGAWGDYDNDGFDDIFIANFSFPVGADQATIQQSQARSQLYHNNQNGTFTEVGTNAGLDLNAMANGCAWGDYDNDGLLDLFVSCYGPNHLYHNNGDGTFSDVSQQAGISQYDNYWTGVAWGDYDRDGLLDLYVCGYVDYQPTDSQATTLQYNAAVPVGINPSSFAPIGNLLFHNLGNGTFEEVSEKTGVKNTTGRSLAVSWCDFDEDGLPDLYVANDVSDNAMFRNTGKGTFEDVSYTAFVADYRGAMGIGIGDWDNDTDFDMFVTHWMAQENALYNNLKAQLSTKDISANNRLKFMDQADRFGLGQIALNMIGFGTFFFAYNNDGYQDLFITNGSTFQQPDSSALLVPMQDQLLWNKGPKDGFFDVSAISGPYFQEAYVGRGAAFSDYDHDGDLDILIINNIGPAKLLRNDNPPAQHWLKINLRDATSNRFGIGAYVRLVSDTMTLVQQVGVQGPYLSQNSLTVHFGLGNHDNVDSLYVRWPSGKTRVLTHVQANQSLTIHNP